MFNMPDLSIKFNSTEKLYISHFHDTSLDSVALNLLEIVPRQNWVATLTFLLSALNLKNVFSISKQIAIIIETQSKFRVCSGKINTHFFFAGDPKLLLIS